MNKHRPDVEEQGKDFDFGAQIADIRARVFKTKEVKQGRTRDIETSESTLTPGTMSKVLNGILPLIAKGANNVLVSILNVDVSHTPTGRPAIEECFDVDTMSSRLNFAIQTFEPVDSSGNGMTKGDAKPKPIEPTSNLIDDLATPFREHIGLNNFKHLFLKGLVVTRGISQPGVRFFATMHKINMHFPFSKHNISDKSVLMPLSVWVPSRKVGFVGHNCITNFGKHRVQIKG
jgi:hypothetical protein